MSTGPLASINMPAPRVVDPRLKRGGAVRFAPSRGAAIVAILVSVDREGGVGGWEVSDRQRKRAATWFGGQPEDTMSLEVLFDVDALPGERTIEERLRVLRAMGTPDGDRPPPYIELSGDIWDHDEGMRWVMTGMSLGERLFEESGFLRRQAVNVSLQRYVPVDEVEAVKVRPTRGNGNRRRTYTSRGGDTLRGIAVRELGDASRWKDLKAWNKKLRKALPDERLRTGTKITVR